MPNHESKTWSVCHLQFNSNLNLKAMQHKPHPGQLCARSHSGHSPPGSHRGGRRVRGHLPAICGMLGIHRGRLKMSRYWVRGWGIVGMFSNRVYVAATRSSARHSWPRVALHKTRTTPRLISEARPRPRECYRRDWPKCKYFFSPCGRSPEHTGLSVQVADAQQFRSVSKTPKVAQTGRGVVTCLRNIAERESSVSVQQFYWRAPFFVCLVKKSVSWKDANNDIERMRKIYYISPDKALKIHF